MSEDDKAKAGVLKIKGLKEPSTEKVRKIIEADLNDLKAIILQDDNILRTIPGNVEAEVINTVLVPKIIREKYPDLTETEVEEVRQHVVIDSVIKSGEIKEVGDKRFIRMAGQFVNIDDLHIDLIDSINPFQEAYEILSKSVNASVLKTIKDTIDLTRIQMTKEEAVLLYNKIVEFKKQYNRLPSSNALDPQEKRMAEAILYLQRLRRENNA